jgi:serine/threonine protein kinase
MFDFRDTQKIDLNKCQKLSPDSTAYLYVNDISHKKYVVKYYEVLNKKEDIYLINEFRKLILLSAEPEIGMVYGLITVSLDDKEYLGYLMDYIDGVNLSSYLSTNPIDFDIYCDLIKQLSSALEKAHHHDVYHNDLSYHNIMIDSVGNLKLIDFFYDVVYVPDNERQENDLISFKKIESSIYEKLDIDNRNRALILHEKCQNATTFKGLTKILTLLDGISFDLNLIDVLSLKIISKIIAEIPTNFKITHCISEDDIKIPKSMLPDITPEEEKYAELNKTSKLKYSDSRREKINHMIDNYLYRIFSQLKLSLLCDYILTTKNTGERFYGPYSIHLQIIIYPKLIQWRNINNASTFLPEVPKEELKELIFNEEFLAHYCNV